MNTGRIAEIVKCHLAEDAPYFGKPPGITTPEHERLAICLNDPKFGWNLVKSLVKTAERYPLDLVMEQPLYRAYHHVQGVYTDAALPRAYSLLHPQSTPQRNLLKGLLFCPRLSIAQIAEWLKLSEDTVALFEALFFNVRDRFDDPGFIASILYPRGKLATFAEDAMDNVDPGLLLMRAGYHYGAKEVANMAGIGNRQDATPPTEKLIEEFNSLTMQNGVTLARHGGLNSKAKPGIGHAKALVVAAQKAKAGQELGDDYVMGLGAISAGEAIMDTIKRSEAPDLQRRHEVIQQEHAREARRQAAAAAETDDSKAN